MNNATDTDQHYLDYVIHETDQVYAIAKDNVIIKDNFTLASAVYLFCIAHQCGDEIMCYNIARLDRLFTKTYTDMVFYKHSENWNRYDDAELYCDGIIRQLELIEKALNTTIELKENNYVTR